MDYMFKTKIRLAYENKNKKTNGILEGDTVER